MASCSWRCSSAESASSHASSAPVRPSSRIKPARGSSVGPGEHALAVPSDAAMVRQKLRRSTRTAHDRPNRHRQTSVPRPAPSTHRRPHLHPRPLSDAFRGAPAVVPADAHLVALAQYQRPCAVVGRCAEDPGIDAVRYCSGCGGRRGVHDRRIGIFGDDPPPLHECIRTALLNRPGHARRQAVLAVEGRADIEEARQDALGEEGLRCRIAAATVGYLGCSRWARCRLRTFRSPPTARPANAFGRLWSTDRRNDPRGPLRRSRQPFRGTHRPPPRPRPRAAPSGPPARGAA